MLIKQNIICISSIDWDFVWQGHQEIMSAFAKQGNRVLFIENTGIRSPQYKDLSRLKQRLKNWLKGYKGFREVQKNLYVYSPLILPLPFSRIFRYVNKYFFFFPLRKWLRVMSFHDPIVWTFLPTFTALDFIELSKPKVLVYYYIADFDHLATHLDKLKEAEKKLIQKSDLIFVQGEDFRKKCSELGHERVYVFPFGVNLDIFEKTSKTKTAESYPKPIIGYVGGIHRHIDMGLIRHIADTFTAFSIVLVGPEQTDVVPLKSYSNIYFTGQKDFTELPNWIAQFDVCIVPYLLNEFTQTVYPTKINEYHAMGKPVVSTYLPEVEAMNQQKLIYIAKTPDDFVKHLRSALTDDHPLRAEARKALAKTNSWGQRITEMSLKIEEMVEKKFLNNNHWVEKFSKLYQRSRRQLFLAFPTLLLWGLLFYTPLFWNVAKPLKLTSALEKSDVILIFSGGVGESGQAGQGYEERVNYGIQLYKQGYAPYLIFSSGSRSTFSESYIMKALALSLGVPENKIILEDKAANTFENVKFSKEILLQKGWKKVILVSSPYHMKRAALVFKKIAPDQKIIYAPPVDSKFYAVQDSDVNGRKLYQKVYARQIKAILHEYMAMFYYWWKGYL